MNLFRKSFILWFRQSWYALVNHSNIQRLLLSWFPSSLYKFYLKLQGTTWFHYFTGYCSLSAFFLGFLYFCFFSIFYYLQFHFSKYGLLAAEVWVCIILLITLFWPTFFRSRLVNIGLSASRRVIIHFLIISYCLLFVSTLIQLENFIVEPFLTFNLFKSQYLINSYTIFGKSFMFLFIALFLLLNQTSLQHLFSFSVLHAFLSLLNFMLLFFCFLLSVNDFFLLFIGFEGFSLTMAIISVLQVQREATLGAVKYFTLNLFATICFLLGVLFLYQEIGSTNYFEVSFYLTQLRETSSFISFRLQSAIILFTIAFLFKLACFPFGMWSVDVYASTNFNFLYLLAILAKFIIFFVFVRTFFIALLPMHFIWAPLLFLFGILSLIVGGFGAYNQKKNFKIFFAFTSMNVMGFVLVLVSLLNYQALLLAYFFLFNYLLGTFNFILILNTVFIVSKATSWIHLRVLSHISPPLHLCLTFQILSLAGLPPTLGFFIKYYSFVALIQMGHIVLGFFLLFFSLITIMYYLRIVHYLWFFQDSTLSNLQLTFRTGVIQDQFQTFISTSNYITFGSKFWKIIPEYSFLVSFVVINTLLSLILIFFSDFIFSFFSPVIATALFASL